MDMTALMVEHDLADTTDLWERAARLDPDRLADRRIDGLPVLPFDSEDVTVLELLRTQVGTGDPLLWVRARSSVRA